jgi:hypothetical protein
MIIFPTGTNKRNDFFYFCNRNGEEETNSRQDKDAK